GGFRHRALGLSDLRIRRASHLCTGRRAGALLVAAGRPVYRRDRRATGLGLAASPRLRRCAESRCGGAARPGDAALLRAAFAGARRRARLAAGSARGGATRRAAHGGERPSKRARVDGARLFSLASSNQKEKTMAAFFQSLGRTIVAGLVVLIVLLIILVAMGGRVALGEHAWWLFAMRWLHVTSGVMWIGLLWYFNFVQTPSMPKIPDPEKPAITKVIAPAALFWFRWAAMATLVLGLILALMNGYLGQALMLKKPFTSIGIGAWLGVIMWFNVWFLIWPNQKKVLGMVTVSPEEKAGAARVAGMASRTNTMLSIPMLYFMVAQSHGGVAFAG